VERLTPICSLANGPPFPEPELKGLSGRQTDTRTPEEMLDKVGDVDLRGEENRVHGAGPAIDARGRSRGDKMGDACRDGAKSALAIAFHHRCDVIVATASIADD
jgi:hypothetical protein